MAILNRHTDVPAEGEDGATGAYTGPVVCWICGYGAEERRAEIRPGECRLAAEWGKPGERCLMNAAAERARGKGGRADA